MRATIIATLAIIAGACSSRGDPILVPHGSVWAYYASGPAPADWAQTGFDDSSWTRGRAQLGYGEGDEQTALFSDPGDAPNTLYFRRTFTVTNLPTLSYVTLRLVADDGAVAYLNGIEVVRRNMPSGAVSFSTEASSVETNGNRFTQFGIYPYRLRSGLNTLAIEVHQHPAGLSHCSFDLELLAGTGPVPSPSIAITAPTNDAVMAVGDIELATSWTDPASRVTRVEFYTNGVLLGAATNEPFSFTWDGPAIGHYQVVARAFDEFYRSGDSPPVHLQVGAGALPQLFRGPYLQSGSATNIVVRWRTDWLTDSVVRYGTNASLPDSAATDSADRFDHELILTGLEANRTYFYSVGSSSRTLAGGNEFYFHTAPTGACPTRLWVIGDSGTSDTNAAGVRDAYYGVCGTNHTDLLLMLGDNAYGTGFDHEYQTAVFAMYPDLLRHTVVWPTLGNHDAGDDPGVYGTHGKDYLGIFTLPKNGEAGGLASGTELYYSFDYANIHVVCLDSFISDNDPDGPMVTWLQSDLAATAKDWIIAFWHHPPYSWGTHDSDAEYFLSNMRERVVPVLEAFGVDLVLSGHSHDYERTFLLDGHYGPSWTLESSMVRDGSLGDEEDSGPYRKPAGGLGAHQGTVYAVCGCSGAGGLVEGFRRHPAMAINHGGFGSMILEIDGLRLRARFLRPTMAIDDSFTIDKSAPATIRPVMEIARHPAGATVSWPTSHPVFALESADKMPATNWQAVSNAIQTCGRRNVTTLATNGMTRFFRLRAAP